MTAAEIIRLIGRTILGTIQFRRGLEASLPALKIGEPAYTTDSHKLFVGTDAGNVEIQAGAISVVDGGSL